MSALPSCCVDIRVSTCGVTRSQIVWAAPAYFNGTIASYRCEYVLSFTIISENKICNKKTRLSNSSGMSRTPCSAALI